MAMAAEKSAKEKSADRQQPIGTNLLTLSLYVRGYVGYVEYV
jgi:hypothetical protein